MTTNYTPINLFSKQRVRVNASVDIIEQSSELNPDNLEGGSLKAVVEENWHNLANVDTFKVTPETEDDEVTYFDDNTKTRVKDPQTEITRRTVEMTAVNFPLLFDAIAMGVPNPTSEETAAMLSAGSEEGAPMFASNDPNVEVGVRVRFYDNKQRLLKTGYFYANLQATGETEYNGKVVKPTITAIVQPSVHNRLFNEAAFTGQTATAAG